MNRRIIIFINAVAAVLLQAIPNTIPMGFYTVYGIGTRMESFFNIGYLWSWGTIWYPVATVCSLAAALFALVYLLRGRAWARYTLLSLEGVVVLCMALPIYEMFLSPKNLSTVILLIAILALANVVLCAIPKKKTAV